MDITSLGPKVHEGEILRRHGKAFAPGLTLFTHRERWFYIMAVGGGGSLGSPALVIGTKISSTAKIPSTRVPKR
jgi:hypothetical protein